MAVNLSVLSSFDASGLNKAQAELEKLQSSVSGGMDSLMASSQVMGAAIIAAGVAAGAALYAMGSQITGAYDNIRVKTGATGAALDSFKGDVRAIVDTIPASFAEAGNAVATFATKLGLSGPQLQDLSKQVIELSRITHTDLGANLDSVAKVMQNFSVGADQQSASLDFLFRASQQSGVGVGQLATSMADTGVQLRAMGFDFNQSAALIATMGKAGIDVSSMMPALNKALASAAKEGKSAGEVFSDTFAKIKNAPDSITASQAALEVFGAKGGVKVAQMIREGKLSYDDMLASINGGTDTIMAAGEDTMHFGEQFTMLKNKAMLALEPIATKLFKAVGDAVAKVIPYVQELSHWLGDHMGIVKAAAIVIGVIAVAALVSYAIAMASAVAATIAAAAPVIAIAAVIGVAIAAVVYLWTHWNQVWNWIKNHPAIAAVIAILGGPILIPLFALIAVGRFLWANWKTIWEGIKTAIQVSWSVIQVIWNALIAAAKFIWNVMQVLSDIAQNVWSAIVAVIQGAWTVIQVIWDALVTAVEFIWNAFQFLWDIVQNVWSGISAAIDAAWTVIQVIWDAIVTGIEMLYNYYQFLWDIVQNVWNGIVSIIGDAWNFLDGIFESIKGGIQKVIDWFLNIPSMIGGIGSGIAESIGQGFKNAWNTVADLINNIIPDKIDFGWGPTIDLPDNPIPRFHSGGIVGGAIGTEIPAMLQAGEMVLTQRQQAALLDGSANTGAAPQYNVVINTVAGDPAAIERIVLDALGRAHVRGMTALRP